jgi:hypothetical protein
MAQMAFAVLSDPLRKYFFVARLSLQFPDPAPQEVSQGSIKRRSEVCYHCVPYEVRILACVDHEHMLPSSDTWSMFENIP